MMDFPSGIRPEARVLKVVSWIFLCMLAGQCILTAISLCSARSASRADFILLTLGITTTLVTLSRDLPWQNVVAASVIVGAVATVIEVFIFYFQRGSRPAFELFWPVPLVWIIAILNARGLSRLVLLRWRSIPTYGFWLFGLTAFLATVFAFVWHFFEKADGYRTFHIQGMGLVQAFGAAGALLLALPWLINKRPGERAPAWEPLMTWLSINLLFVTEAFCQRSFITATVLLLTNLLIPALAVANHASYREFVRR